MASSFSQMVSSAEEIASRTQMASQESSEVESHTNRGQQLVADTLADIEQLSTDMRQSVKTINQLEADSDAISQVLDVIKGLAEQTTCWPLTPLLKLPGLVSRGAASRWWPTRCAPWPTVPRPRRRRSKR